MGNYYSKNPFNQNLIAEFDLDSPHSLESKVLNASTYKPLKLNNRINKVLALAAKLQENQKSLAQNISLEVGKPLKESRAEIDKCIKLCHYYADSAEEILKTEELDIDGSKAYRSYEPLGIVLGIMPWNFPFWQVFRFAVPTILAGNSVLLKHAPNCQLCAESILEAFNLAGFSNSAYQNIRLENEAIATLIADERIQAISLTGSTKAGKEVAQKAAFSLKPQVLELGGSNAFILHHSASVSKAAALAAQARLMNAGQSCIAAKRFLVPRTMELAFLEALKEEFSSFKMGDPMLEETDLGPMARMDLKEKALLQMLESMELGAKLVLGGGGEGLFLEATILSEVKPNMPVFKEEVFAPIAAVCLYDTWEDAIALSNNSSFGLGVSLIGDDEAFLMDQASYFKEGAVFINDLVKSDPRLPFGGIKQSGYGRELGPEGLRAFTNLKTIYNRKR